MDSEANATTTVQLDSSVLSGAECEAMGEKKFGTFQGVFRPTILTILGVMMYLREGWLVGNAGIIGAILLILACYLITGATALSLASITTNIRVGSGGAFSIISQSLGLEVGGSIGIPLYLAQGMSAAMYMYGFWEGWHYIFPHHPQALVLLVVFAVTLALSYLSAHLAFRVQILIMLVIAVALGSILLGADAAKMNPDPQLWGEFKDGRFWYLFAVFFPASTGIMVGASMSGNLQNPRRSIPVGTLCAWGVSLLVYLALALWYGLMATPEQLMAEKTIAFELAAYGPAVIVGVLASCFSAGLSSMVAAPRVLQALGANRIIPFHQTFAALKRGEPRAAVAFTASLCGVTLLLGDLDTIATVLTMFFLMTYFSINLVLVIEQRLNLISFRPEFRVPTAVPVVGSIACLVAMLVINPLVGLLCISISLGIYVYLDHKALQTPWETVHSGLFFSIASWAAKHADPEDRTNMKRSWRPDILVPIERQAQFEGNFRLIRALAMPQGSIHVLGMRSNPNSEFRNLQALVRDLHRDNLYARAAVVDALDFRSCLKDCVAVMSGAFFQPNIIFTALEGRDDADLASMIAVAKANTMSVVLLVRHPEAALGQESSVNVWVRDQSPDWSLGLKLANLDCAVLLSHQLKKNWNARVRMLSVVEDAEHVELARAYLTDLLGLARMSRNVSVQVEHGRFSEAMRHAPRADIHILGLAESATVDGLQQFVRQIGGSCLFVLDSGVESALA